MQGRAWMAVAGFAAVMVGWSGVASAQHRGVQFTPDGQVVLVNKDVGTERWAIALNEDGSATGNVFRSDGGDPAFVYCAPQGAPNTFECFGADACTDGSGAQRGIQGTPDGHRVLVQKDVGTERWAISLNFANGTATGNIFRADGGEPAFVFCEPTGAPNEFDCSGADKCEGTSCPNGFTPIGRVTLPESFFAVPDPCNQTFTSLGTVTLPASFFAPSTQVTFTVGASAPLQAFQLRVTYSTAKGSFDGAGETTNCTADAGGAILVANDNDATGALIFSVSSASNLTLPVDVRCQFNATGTLAPSDLTVQVQEVTQNNQPGDPSVLTVDIGVD